VSIGVYKAIYKLLGLFFNPNYCEVSLQPYTKKH